MNLSAAACLKGQVEGGSKIAVTQEINLIYTQSYQHFRF